MFKIYIIYVCVDVLLTLVFCCLVKRDCKYAVVKNSFAGSDTSSIVCVVLRLKYSLLGSTLEL